MSPRAPAVLRAKRRLKRLWWTTRRPTARWRALPDFLVIGAQKSGTTSLHEYLVAHPDVRRPFGQELTFFSDEVRHGRGLDHYRTGFPLEVGRRRGRAGRPWITGEASGEYLYYPTAPERVAAAVPDVRLVLVLRDPADRAVSAYFHNVAIGTATDPIEQTLGDEIRWHTGEVEFWGPAHRRFGPWGAGRACIGRGLYAHHLRRWLEVFGPDQLLVLEAEGMYEDPEGATRRVAAFVGADPERSPTGLRPHNTGSKRAIDPELDAWLRELYRGPNAALRALLDDAYGPGAVPLRWAG